MKTWDLGMVATIDPMAGEPVDKCVILVGVPDSDNKDTPIAALIIVH